MNSRLIDSLATTPALDEAFSDRALLRAMLDFEVALAAAQARAGLIPSSAAETIARVATPGAFEVEALAHDARASATVSIPFVKALIARVHAADESSARFVHFGATSQDVFDTALVICLRRAHASLVVDHTRLLRGLILLSDAHATTVMLGRTLLQPATPTTMGLKAAGWAGGLARAGATWQAAHERAMVLQFGGAAGTLAALGTHAESVEQALADGLGLTRPDAPWHAHRDRLAALVTALGVYVAELGKMATDLVLLMQHEVGEVFEPGGGSSTMPHKRNPSGSAIVLAAAARAPGLVSAFLGGMLQPHERSAGGWHAEAPTIVALVQACGSALAAAANAIEGLTVDRARMRENLTATRGVIFAERLVWLLVPAVGRDAANQLVAAAIAESQQSRRTFGTVAAATPAIATHLSPDTLRSLDMPEAYLGATEIFRQRLLAHARAALES